MPQLAGQCGAVLDEHIASSSSCDRFCARLELPIYENAGDSAASFSKGFTATSQLTNSASVMVRSSLVVAHLLCFRFRARLWPTTTGSGSRARIPGGLTSGTCASNTRPLVNARPVDKQVARCTRRRWSLLCHRSLFPHFFGADGYRRLENGFGFA